MTAERMVTGTREWDRRWLPVVLAFVVGVGYVAFSATAGGPGFPLDDGWIHQTYARNLAATGRWAYAPGTLSNGSTSPLWTLLLAAGYRVGLPHFLWNFSLGLLFLGALSWAGIRFWRSLWPTLEDEGWWAAVILVLSWPLVWAALSGMETMLFLALAMALLALYLDQSQQNSVWLGVIAGLLVLTRPEGILLVSLIALALLLQRAWKEWLRYLLGVSLLLLPYFAFNMWLSGELWPNTFYAKQAEYAALLRVPIHRRLLQLLYLSLGGAADGWRGMSAAHLLLLPGLLLAGWQGLRRDWAQRRLYATLPLVWAFSHLAVYAWRLPVTYQHGRYLWATLPVWILYGLAGWRQILAHKALRKRIGRVLRRAAVAVFVIILLLFLLLGASAYANDVAFVQNEMVDVALWLRQNTPPDAIIAAHDIGAIGFFAERPLLDLAGLISPEVIPLLQDEAALARYVQRSPADYLVTAPGWQYAALTCEASVVLVYETGYEWTREAGLNNMAVYRLP